MNTTAVPEPRRTDRRQVVAAGLLYFAVVFAAGFALGILRTLVLEPWLGALTAVAVELPFILTLAWLACGRILGRLRIAARPGARLAMGAIAFACLIAAEIGLTILAGRTLADFFAGIATSAGAVGLAGQVVFGVMPVLRR